MKVVINKNEDDANEDSTMTLIRKRLIIVKNLSATFAKR